MLQTKWTKVPFGKPGEKYKVYAPGAGYLTDLWLSESVDRLAFQRERMGQVSGRFWRFDWTFRTAKYVRNVEGEKVFTGVFTIMNEYGELVLQLFTQSPDNMQEIDAALQRLQQHLVNNNLQVPFCCLLCFCYLMHAPTTSVG